MMEDGPKTLSVPEAGKRYFGLGKNSSYEAAHRGELPVIKIGSRLRVPVAAVERMLEAAGEAWELRTATRETESLAERLGRLPA